MVHNYLYIRNHEAYKIHNAVKLGISTCIGSRDNQYATGEIKRGSFIHIYKLIDLDDNLPIARIEKLLHTYFKILNKHIYIDGGREFFNIDIVKLIPSFLDKINVKYVLLSSDEINKIINDYRFNAFTKKLLQSRINKDNIYKTLLKWLNNIRAKKLIPSQQQQDILDRIPEFYKNNTIGKIYWACGLGKALLALFIARVLNAKNIVIGVPSVYLQSQMKKEILKLFSSAKIAENILCVGGDDKTSTTNNKIIKRFLDSTITTSSHKFIITTYDSCYLLALLSLEDNFQFDFKIGDEAHHLVAKSNTNEVSQQSFIKFHDILAAKSLFMTATPKIITYKFANNILASNEDSDEESNEIIYSMDDESKFGKIIDEKNVKWAIENKKITDYKVFVLYNTIYEIRAMTRQYNIVDKDMELFTSAYMTLKSLEKHQDLTHILIYTNTTENSDIIAKYINDILENENIILAISSNSGDDSNNDIYIKSLHSNSKGCNLEDEVKKFSKAKIGIISCVYIFGEGFDLPKLNGVAFAENMISPIRTIQCALRPNRLDKNNPNKNAYVIIPYLDREECGICNKSFRKCFNILDRLRNDDDILGYNKIYVSSLVDNNESNNDDKEIDISLEESEPKTEKEVGKINKNKYIQLQDNPLELEKIKLRLKHSTHLKRVETPEKDELEFMKLLNRQIGITSRNMYFDSSIRKKYTHWIAEPVEYFSKNKIWQGWYIYLGIDTSIYPDTKEDWTKYCVSRGITNYEEYFEKQKNDSRLPEFPNELYPNLFDIEYELNQSNSLFRRRT
jgi:superfamily II DNA or RNA helicase